jgi:hypothetical protein
MEQLPALVSETVLPAIVQFPAALKLTSRPEEAEALTVKGASAAVLFGSGPKVIDWLAWFIWNVWETGAAAS